VMLNRDVTVTPLDGDWTDGWKVPDPTQAGRNFDVHERVKAVVISISGATPITYRFDGRIRDEGGIKFNLTSVGSAFKSSACVAVDASGRPYTKDGPCAG